MHREIMSVTDPKVKVDHKNHDTLDNQKHNLRPCTNSRNMMNRSGCIITSASGIRGVVWEKDRGSWKAQIMLGRKCVRLGSFSDKNEADRVVRAAREKHFGEFAGAA